MSDIIKEIAAVIETEGGYVNHPHDPGGETKYGITKRTYPKLDIKNLTKEEAADIYKRDFYDALRLSEVKSDSVRWKLLDMAVNMGQLRTRIYAQRVLGVEVDGVFGPETLHALNTANETELLTALVDTCVLHYTRTVVRDPKKLAFLEGWMNRAIKRTIA